jgi:hypothetical protein
MGSFRNRIINGDMRIAQRGTSFTLTDANKVYGLDRWASYTTGTVSVEQRTLVSSDAPFQQGLMNSFRMTGASGGPVTTYETIQTVEGYNFNDLNWGTSFGQPVTLSFWFRSLCSQGSTFSIAIRSGNASTSYVSPFIYNTPTAWQYYSVTIPPPPNGTTGISVSNGSGLMIEIGSYHSTSTLWGDPNTWAASNRVMVKGSTNVLATPGNYIEFTGVQLEKGTVATPWEQRPYATELALCQRYYQQFGGGGNSNYVRFAAGNCTNSGAAHLSMPTIVPMRGAPTTLSNSAMSTFYLESATNVTPTAMGVGDCSPLNIGLNISLASGLTAGNGCILIGNNTSAAFIGVSAEL